MNRPMPQGNRRDRGIDSCRTSRSSGTLPGALGLVSGTSNPPEGATPPGRNPAARKRETRCSAFDGVGAFAVLALGGRDGQAHFLLPTAPETAFRDPVRALLNSNRNQGDFLLGLTF